MVVIRLSRGGSKHRPFFNIIVSDSRNRRDGRFIEKIGFYNPIANDKQEKSRIDSQRFDYWVSKGAQISNIVKKLAKKSKTSAL